MLPLALYCARPSPGRAPYTPTAAVWTGGSEANPNIPHLTPEGPGLGEGETLNRMPDRIRDDE